MEAVKAVVSWVWSKWKKVGHFITRILNTILLVLAYAVAIGPVAIALRIAGQDILDKKWKAEKPESWWLPREPISDDPERYQRQF